MKKISLQDKMAAAALKVFLEEIALDTKFRITEFPECDNRLRWRIQRLQYTNLNILTEYITDVVSILLNIDSLRRCITRIDAANRSIAELEECIILGASSDFMEKFYKVDRNLFWRLRSANKMQKLSRRPKRIRSREIDGIINEWEIMKTQQSDIIERFIKLTRSRISHKISMRDIEHVIEEYEGCRWGIAYEKIEEEP